MKQPQWKQRQTLREQHLPETTQPPLRCPVNRFLSSNCYQTFPYNCIRTPSRSSSGSWRNISSLSIDTRTLQYHSRQVFSLAMPSYFQSIISFACTLALSFINRAFPTWSTKVGHRQSTPSMLELPAELVLYIFTLAFASEVPVNLAEFIDLGHRNQKYQDSLARLTPSARSYTWLPSWLRTLLATTWLATLRLPSADSYAWFLGELHHSQKEHYMDWLAINALPWQFRRCGYVLFGVIFSLFGSRPRSSTTPLRTYEGLCPLFCTQPRAARQTS